MMLLLTASWLKISSRTSHLSLVWFQWNHLTIFGGLRLMKIGFLLDHSSPTLVRRGREQVRSLTHPFELSPVVSKVFPDHHFRASPFGWLLISPVRFFVAILFHHSRHALLRWLRLKVGTDLSTKEGVRCLRGGFAYIKQLILKGWVKSLEGRQWV